MKKQGQKGIGWGVGSAMVALVLAGAPAFAAEPGTTSSTSRDMSGSKPTITQTTQATVVVTAVDKSTRHLTVKKPDGELRSFFVPSDVSGFDKLRPGDQIDVVYGESWAVEMMAPGSKTGQSQQTARAPGMVGQKTVVSAEVLGVDLDRNQVTMRGPDGDVQTITVKDPAMQRRLPSVKPGQVAQFSYTEAMIASIKPHAGEK